MKGTCSSRSRSLPHYYWNATRDDSMLFTWSRWGTNTLCITTGWDVKSLHVLGSSTTHGRTSKKFLGSGTQLPHSVWGGREWLTRANNYRRLKLDPFSRARKKISKHSLEKKRKKGLENSRMSGPAGRWC